MTPMYREPLGADMLRRARRSSRPTSRPPSFADATLAWLERHYRPETTVGGA